MRSVSTVIVGAGHVGVAVHQLASWLAMPSVLWDDRDQPPELAAGSGGRGPLAERAWFSDTSDGRTEEVARLAPNDAEFALLRGQVSMAEERWEDARTAFERQRELSPEEREILASMAAVIWGIRSEIRGIWPVRSCPGPWTDAEKSQIQ